MIYYHITSGDWDGGDLQCWNTREALGIASEWKWPDAPVGQDGHLVALALTLDDIYSVVYAGDIEGTILRIDIPDDVLTDSVELDWDDPDEDRIHLTAITEGLTTYPAVLARIPARYITRI